MDVFLTSGARADLDILGILPPIPGTWGLLRGHERGFRLYIERIFPLSSAGGPSAGLRLKWDRILDGRLIGFFAFRPAAALKKALLGPGFYRQLYLEVSGRAGRLETKAFVVDHKDRFFFSPLALKPVSKGTKP